MIFYDKQLQYKYQFAMCPRHEGQRRQVFFARAGGGAKNLTQSAKFNSGFNPHS